MAPQGIASEALFQLRVGIHNAIKSLDNPIRHPIRFVSEIIQWQLLFLFEVFQWFANKLFSPTPPGPNTRLRRPKIAIIGAGITGVTSAAHCIGHGFDVTIFEAGDKNSLGGIWSVSGLTLFPGLITDNTGNNRKSTTLLVFRFILSCIGFTHPSNGNTDIQTDSRSSAR